MKTMFKPMKLFLSPFLLGSCAVVATGACAVAPEPTDETETEQAAVSATPVSEKDIALVFTKTGAPVASATTAVGTSQLLPAAWYRAAQDAFLGSGAEGAFEDNNTRDEWRNVSTRIEPCAPLGIAPFQAADTLCWPEVRLVMQPIKARVTFSTSTFQNYADDRGIHLLFDVPGNGVLAASELAEAKILRAKVVAAVDAGTWTPTSGQPLSAAEAARFVVLRNKVARAVLADAVALRGAGFAPEKFAGFGARPELADAASRARFVGKYAGFVGKYAQGAALKQLTSFSLRAVRSTTPDWEGAFVSLRPRNGTLQPEPIGIRSPVTGRELLPTPPKVSEVIIEGTGRSAGLNETQAQSGAPQFNEPPQNFPNAEELRGLTFLPREEKEIPELLGLILPPSPESSVFRSLVARISDRKSVLVPNSSCASCHVLQQDNVLKPGASEADSSNLHNLSFFQADTGDRGFSTSPRVVKDVAFDLAWIGSRL